MGTKPEASGKARRDAASLQDYFQVTRRLSVGLLFAVPLLLVYEIGVLASGGDINGAAVLAKIPGFWLEGRHLQLLGTDVMVYVNGLLVIALLATVWRVERLGALRLKVFAGMLAESIVYALILWPIALAPITGKLELGGFAPRLQGFWHNLVVSGGAGFYEEALFRLVLLGLIFHLVKTFAHLKPFTAGLVALVGSAGIFSAVHFLNPGERPDLGAFIYRLMAGILLGLIYLTRGFGIAAWTHALYDLYVLCLAR